MPLLKDRTCYFSGVIEGCENYFDHRLLPFNVLYILVVVDIILEVFVDVFYMVSL